MSALSALSKITAIDRRWIWLVVMVAFAIPIIRPLAIPISISEETRKAFDAIESFPEGSVVMLDVEMWMRYYPELGPTTEAFIYHVLKKNLKLVIWASSAEGAPFAETALRAVNPEKMGKRYGVDYVHLGYIAGGEKAMASLMTDIHSTVTTDYYGNKITDLKIMENVRSSKDIKTIACVISTQPDDRVRQYSITGGIKWIALTSGGWVPGIKPFVASGHVLTTVGGIRGGAEYELLVGRPGSGLISTDITSVTLLLMVALVVLSNIGYFAERAAGGRRK
ncbi:MAG: hypothetical protein QW638_04845 [Candidatus Bathyarchaeia archaeon]